jgi:hypothetical protein
MLLSHSFFPEMEAISKIWQTTKNLRRTDVKLQHNLRSDHERLLDVW